MTIKAGTRLNILVVDDDENIRIVLDKALSKLGHHVSTSKSAEQALAVLQRSFFHVVITDLHMDEMNGIELLTEIKELNSMMQVFIITAHSNLPNVIQCMKGGAYDYFEKPLEIDEVISSINEASRRASRWSKLYEKYTLGK
ncbi:response regulator [Deltaproteobacteria bacterium TL4]